MLTSGCYLVCVQADRMLYVVLYHRQVSGIRTAIDGK